MNKCKQMNITAIIIIACPGLIIGTLGASLVSGVVAFFLEQSLCANGPAVFRKRREINRWGQYQFFRILSIAPLRLLGFYWEPIQMLNSLVCQPLSVFLQLTSLEFSQLAPIFLLLFFLFYHCDTLLKFILTQFSPDHFLVFAIRVLQSPHFYSHSSSTYSSSKLQFFCILFMNLHSFFWPLEYVRSILEAAFILR